MGFLRKIADRFDPPREKRAADPSWAALAGAGADWATALGAPPRRAVRPELAESVATVIACIQAISSAMASLPAYVFRREEDGRAVDDAHALSRLIRDGANHRQSWPDFIEWIVAQALAHGNGLAEIVADRSGRIAELRPIPWPNITAVLLPNGRLAFDISDVESRYGGTGRVRRLLADEVLHLRDRSDDGILGRSRLSRCATPIRTALTQEAFGELLYENQAAPSGFLKVAGDADPDEIERLKHSVREAWSGVRRAGMIGVLAGGLDFTPISITPENLEMLAARRFSTEEIARLYQVPPPIVGIWDHSTFTNSETAGRWFAQFCLAPWIRKLEEAFRRDVFSAASRATHEIEFDMTGFLRGDAEARWKAHEIAVRNRILTANEVREVEGWNPRPELDAPLPGSGPATQSAPRIA